MTGREAAAELWIGDVITSWSVGPRNVERWTWSSTRLVPDRVQYWLSAVKPASARARFCVTAPNTQLVSRSDERPASSRRWSCRSRPSTSCARRCSTISHPSRCLSRERSKSRSDSPWVILPTGSSFALAALSLASEASADRPLLLLVDDAQWLDSASRQAFGFIARRLVAECVAMVFAVRTPSRESDLESLPSLLLKGLPEGDASLLLENVVLRKLDDSTRDRLLAESQGNPLALLELPHRISPAQLPGALGPHTPHERPNAIEDSFVERVQALPEDARMLLLAAAAEPADDSSLLWRAVRRLGIEVSARPRPRPRGC